MGIFGKSGSKKIRNSLMELGYDNAYIKKHNMDSLTESDIDMLKSDDDMRAIAEVVAKRKRTTFYNVFEELKHAKEKYGIAATYFGYHSLYGKGEEALQEAKEKIDKKQHRAVVKLAKVTGWTPAKSEEKAEAADEKFGINPATYYDQQFYRLTDEELADHVAAEEAEDKRCREWVRSETGWSDYEITRHIHYCRIRFGINPGYYYPTRCWQVSDDVLKTYANQRDSYKLKKKYNDPKAIPMLANKIKFNESFGDLTGRKYWINRDTSFEEFEKFVDGLDVLFCKPFDLSHATGTKKVKVEGDHKALYDSLMAEPKTLVEECVKQHHEIDEFYNNSVNTVRIFCLIDHDKFYAFAGFMRFGAEGVADNIVRGGVGCGIDMETGTLDTPAIDKFHNFHEAHPVSGKKFEGFKIPNWDLVLEIAEKGLRKYEGINYAGWDIAVCEDKAVLIEGNSVPSLGTYQMFYGGRHEGKKDRYKRFLK